jgi:glucans biosynthesis protein
MRRRDWLKVSGVLAAALALNARAGAQSVGAPKRLGKARPFDYARLKGDARALAAQAYRPRSAPLPEAIKRIGYDAYQAIDFRRDRGLWTKQDRLLFDARFFHLGLYFHDPVHIHEVVDGQAYELAYDPAMFLFGPKSGLQSAALPADLGFAGFRLIYHTDRERDVAAFLGASYFRAVGGELQYGLSARGLAVDTGAGHPEEFPAFTDFWLERPASGAQRVTVYALLNSPSVAGAYRFEIVPGSTLVMDVDAALYPRRLMERIGVAPLTSMFQHGENDRRAAHDWRPEIHDSDGLALWAGSGEWIWRPLVNPTSIRLSVFQDDNPRGFGLLQRDREFDHYQDDGAFYERRPSLWVEPRGGWGKGSVQLVELPTAEEIFDNIVAFWNPARKPDAGQEWLFSYRLHWGSRMPFAPALGQVVATRTGIGGTVGQPRAYPSWRFVVDFGGGALPMIGEDAEVEAVIDASRGEIENVSTRPLRSLRGYRATFDLKPPGDNREPIDLRMYLHLGPQALTETWLYQWSPPARGERA